MMKYTKEVPTAEGYYWVKYSVKPFTGTEIETFCYSKGGFVVILQTLGNPLDANMYCNVKFAGPIEKPQG